MATYNLIPGAIKVQGVLEELCVDSVADLVRVLPKYLTVEVPDSISNVVISSQQPGAEQKQSLWVRLSNSGDFLGLYVYAVGEWRQVTPVPSQLFLISGDSRTPPAGYTLATNATSLTTAQKDFLKAQWHWNDDVVNTYYDIFHVVFTGF